MKSHRIKLSIAVTLLLIAVSVLVGTRDWGASGPEAADRSYYYDIERGELFEADYGLKMPVADPQRDGAEPAGVLAHVFACGNCADEADRFIGYLEYRDPKPMSPNPVRLAEPPADGQSPRWVAGAKAQSIRDAAERRCDGAEPIQCRP